MMYSKNNFSLSFSDNLTLHGKINDINLAYDIARHDVDLNRVTGVKAVRELTVKNLEGSNFGRWAEDVFMQSNTEKLTVVKGKKTFNTLSARILK